MAEVEAGEVRMELIRVSSCPRNQVADCCPLGTIHSHSRISGNTTRLITSEAFLCQDEVFHRHYMAMVDKHIESEMVKPGLTWTNISFKSGL